MVFGWGKKKAQKQEPEKPAQKEKEIALDEIKPVIEDIKELRTKTIISEVKSYRRKMESKLDDIKKIINNLEHDPLKVDDIDKHLEILVVRGKKLVVSTIKRETSESLPEITSYDDILTLNAMINQMLKRMGDVLGRQSKVIHIFAKKYASKLKNTIAILNSDRSELQTLIDNHTTLNDNIKTIYKKIKSYSESKTKLDKTNKRISELKDSVEQYDKTIESTKKNIDDHKSSEKYSKFLDVQKKIDSLSDEKSQIKNQIGLQFTKISRPLSRYEYVSALDKQQKGLLQQLADNPFDVLTLQNKDNIIKIFSAVRKGVQGGTISVKDSDKSLTYIDETIELLDSFISQVNEFTSKKKNLEDDFKVFDTNELKKLEGSLIKTIGNKADAESKIKRFENEITETKKNLPHILMDIEIKLQSVSATKYHIIT